MATRPWVKRVGLGMVFGVVVALSIPAVVLTPYVRDDWALDGIVRAVALDWRDFGRERARARLEYELDHQSIGLHVRDDDCALTEDDSGTRRVACSWGVLLSVPGLGGSLPLSFGSEALVAEDGSLVP